MFASHRTGEGVSKQSSKVTFDVIGTCPTRDVFENYYNNKFVVNKKIQVHTSQICVKSDFISSNPLDYSDLKGYKYRHTLLMELNKTAIDELDESGSEWVLLDLRSFGYDTIEVDYGVEKHYYTKDWIERDRSLFECYAAKKGCGVMSISNIPTPDIPLLEQNIVDVCTYLKKRYGNNIIVLDLYESPWFLNSVGEIQYEPTYDAAYRNQNMNKYVLKIIDYLNCYYIKCPSNVIADYNNRFGRDNVHYCQEYYDYASKCIDIITECNSDWLIKVDHLFIEYTHIFDEIRSQTILSRRNTVRQFEELLNKEPSADELDKIIDKASVIISNTNDTLLIAELSACIGRFYRDRQDGKNDLYKAAEWMRKGKTAGIGWIMNDLFDILWKINTPESNLEMICLAYEYSNQGDAPMEVRLGRAYREGRGVLFNLDEAAKWMKKAIDDGCSWAKVEYFDILWSYTGKNHDEDMFNFIVNLASTGNREYQSRLARCYRDGRGTEKDMEQARIWMKKAADKGLSWAQWEYFDILWSYNDEVHDLEAFTYAKPKADEGLRGFQARLARCYRDGRGTEKDMEQARIWMKKAADQDLSWAIDEYDQLLSENDVVNR